MPSRRSFLASLAALVAGPWIGRWSSPHPRLDAMVLRDFRPEWYRDMLWYADAESRVYFSRLEEPTAFPPPLVPEGETWEA